MADDERGEPLLAFLNTWARAQPVSRGVDVTFEVAGVPRTVTMVFEPGDWAGYSGTHYGTDDPADTDIRSRLLAVPRGLAFLVYDAMCYEWEASATPVIPADPHDDVQPEPGGEWVVLDADGNVTSRYADWIEPDARKGGQTS